jgi:hypothetical protein
MSKFFEDQQRETTQYIPPDYTQEEEVKEEDDIPEIDSDEDEGKIETDLDKLSQQKEEKEEIKEMTPSAFGQPSTTPSGSGGTGFGTGPAPFSTPSFGGNSGSPWQQRQNSPWGQSGGSIWGGSNNNTQKEQIDRNKQILFCDFLDCVVETWDSQGRPGYLPRDIYDLRPRFEVWQKISAFNPRQVYMMIPVNLIPNTAGDEGWIKTLEYFCCALCAYLRLAPGSCRILAQTLIGQPKEDLMMSILNSGPIKKSDVIYIGIYSGLAGQSNQDQVAAIRCGIDYLDLGMLLNNMY